MHSNTLYSRGHGIKIRKEVTMYDSTWIATQCLAFTKKAEQITEILETSLITCFFIIHSLINNFLSITYGVHHPNLGIWGWRAMTLPQSILLVLKMCTQITTTQDKTWWMIQEEESKCSWFYWVRRYLWQLGRWSSRMVVRKKRHLAWALNR